MPGRLQDTTALITGAAKGIGAATARVFAAEGASVVLCDTDRPGLEAVAAELGDAALAHTLDVASPEGWAAAVEAGVGRFGGLDVLVNVAGIVVWDGVEDAEMADWDRVVAVNQTGTWLGMKTAMPALRASGRGSVVNVCSMLGVVGSGGAVAYQATKGAVRLITKTAAVEYATQGVRVNCVHPGVIATPMIQEILDEEGDQQPDIQRTPMKRAGRADEVAWAIVFLAASEESSYVTGAEIPVDGGVTAH